MANAVPHGPIAARAVTALERWLTAHALAMVLAAAVCVATGQGGWIALAAVASFTAAWRSAGSEARFGLANALTAARLGAVLLAAAASTFVPASWVLAAFVFNVAADAVDGRVARARGAATRFGAVFDRETDALFVLVAYLHLHLAQDWGAWLLLPGLMPYAYRLTVTMSPAALAPDRKERFAGALAGLNFVLLLGAVAAPRYAAPMVVLSVAVVCVSFVRSFVGLYRHARARR